MTTHRFKDEDLLTALPHVASMDRLCAIMHRLRAPGGCPWDAEQSHTSLLPNLLEETYEVVDTIEREDWTHLSEELGDVLLQVVFHSEIASEKDVFDLDMVAHGISDKLIRRHPHVFAAAEAGTPDEVLRQWDIIKRAEKGDEAAPYLHATGVGLPALMRAAKLQKKAAKVGFDWPSSSQVIDKIREEILEVEEEISNGDRKALASEIGDLLFAVVNLARKEGFDPEALMAAANKKFTDRFHAMESVLAATDTPLGSASLETMESVWQSVKTTPPEISKP